MVQIKLMNNEQIDGDSVVNQQIIRTVMPVNGICIAGFRTDNSCRLLLCLFFYRKKIMDGVIAMGLVKVK